MNKIVSFIIGLSILYVVECSWTGNFSVPEDFYKSTAIDVIVSNVINPVVYFKFSMDEPDEHLMTDLEEHKLTINKICQENRNGARSQLDSFDNSLKQLFPSIFSDRYFDGLPYEAELAFTGFIDSLLDPCLKKYRKNTSVHENPTATLSTESQVDSFSEKDFYNISRYYIGFEPRTIGLFSLTTKIFPVTITCKKTSNPLILENICPYDLKLLKSYTPYLCNSGKFELRSPFYLVKYVQKKAKVDQYDLATYTFPNVERILFKDLISSNARILLVSEGQ